MSNNNKQNLLTRADSAVIPQQKLLGLLQLIRLPPPSGHTMPGLPTKLDGQLNSGLPMPGGLTRPACLLRSIKRVRTRCNAWNVST